MKAGDRVMCVYHKHGRSGYIEWYQDLVDNGIVCEFIRRTGIPDQIRVEPVRPNDFKNDSFTMADIDARVIKNEIYKEI